MSSAHRLLDAYRRFRSAAPNLNRSEPGNSSQGADPSKASPNAGEPRAQEPYKTWYARERIQLSDGVAAAFTNDRAELGSQFRRLPGFHIRGRCPSCNHETSAVCATWFQAHKATDDNGRGQLTQLTVVRCACTYNHVASTPGDFGCGSEWLLRVTFDPKGAENARITVAEAGSAVRGWPLADTTADDVAQCVTAAQNTAKNWGTALGGVLTLLGIGALLANRATVQALDTTWQLLFALAALVAVSGNVIMLLQTDLAQFGTPGGNKTLQPGHLGNADLVPLIQASSSKRKLRRAVWATAVAVVAALAALAILIFVEPRATSKITYDVNGIAITTPCSTIVSEPPATGSGTVAYQPNVSGSHRRAVNSSQIKSIAGC